MYLTSKKVEDKLNELRYKYKLFQKEYKKLVKPIQNQIYGLEKTLFNIREREKIMFHPQKHRRKKTRDTMRKNDYPYFDEWVKKQEKED